MVLDFAADPILAARGLAWTMAVGIGLWTYARRPDAAGRAFALFVVVWAGGVQLLLTLQSMATDVPTAQLLYRAAYYATLFTTPAFLAVLCLVPAPVRHRGALLGAVLGIGLLVLAGFALDHTAFVAESVTPAGYAVENVAFAEYAYHPLIWTGFLAGLVWLGWRFPRLPERLQGATSWLLAGLGLFAADRFARLAAQLVLTPDALPTGLEGSLYVGYTLAFGPVVVWVAWRALRKPAGLRTLMAIFVGLCVGATGFLTLGLAGLPLTVLAWGSAPVLLSALLGPVYVLLMARGVREASAEVEAYARGARGAVLAES